MLFVPFYLYFLDISEISTKIQTVGLCLPEILGDLAELIVVYKRIADNPHQLFNQV